ncbi:MAG: DUF3127 domain-containing protein [Bacteroidales bacterium]|nr:DUF3127 domain-containing protein [Bacteroidales bacterium]
MEIQIEGKLIQKLALESGTSARGEWKKQNFIIETVEQFPRKICVAAWTNSIPVLDTFQVGEMVCVSVNIESREFNGKWYTDVRAWRIDRPGQNPMQQPAAMPYGQPMQQGGYPQQPQMGGYPPQPQMGGYPQQGGFMPQGQPYPSQPAAPAGEVPGGAPESTNDLPF